MSYQDQIQSLIATTETSTPQQIIQFAHQKFQDKLTFASSLGEEDQVLMDIISKTAPDIEVFTLDTGRLFPETYDLIRQNQKKYALTFKIYYPDSEAVEDMVSAHGINLFYDSVENRKLCCGVRKIQPLRRALKDKDAWICGLRRGQSITRSTVMPFEWDEPVQKVKINPLAYWSLDQVREYIKENNVDINPLHEKGFISIGCASCTRAVKPGEDLRSGRWWWENADQRECGLHNHLNRPSIKPNK